MRKAGIPLKDSDGNPILDENGVQKTGSERSVKQIVHRLAGCWLDWGKRYKYFDDEESEKAFYDEAVYMLLHQYAAPNSPQWFNTGLYWAYGITGSKQGHYYVDPETKEIKKSQDAYSRPQPHACFIQSINDDLVNQGGIFDLLTREARIFKYGSGTGSNFSNLRGEKEPLSGGGISSGMMSFLKIFDRAAGAVKSGGTTRRAAKMVIVNVDHPDIETFIDWKSKEEEKVAALVAGSKIKKAFMQAILDSALANGTDRKKNDKLNKLIKKAIHRGLPLNYIQRTLALVEQGYTNIDFEAYDAHFESEAYNTVSGQNSNNTVRVTNEFMEAVENDGMWDLKFRTSNKTIKTLKARDLWEKINSNAWKSADPGLQYDTTINEWHTCPEDGRINASNPCSEYMFLDDTACNLASLNLIKFYDAESETFDIEAFRHASKIWTVILEISVLMAQFPSEKVAELSYLFRTTGLGYANIGALLMTMGLPYDSDEGRAIAGAIAAIMTGEAYKTSALLAKDLGTFEAYERNKESMLKVIRNHRRAAYNSSDNEYEDLAVIPHGINPEFCSEDLVKSAKEVWDEALEYGEKYGYRNAQVSVIAPTGTIGLLMDCDTTGIEPDFAHVKFKKLAGGGYFKIINQSIPKALSHLGYSESEIKDISNYVVGSGSLKGCPSLEPDSLLSKGFSLDKIETIEKALPGAYDIKFVFNKWTLGEEFLKGIGISEESLNDPNFDLLKSIGLSPEQIDRANDYVCGSMMIEGAPHLKKEHYAIFDTANKCGKKGERYIPYMAHLKIMATVQPFITGAISKTVNMPSEATVKEIGEVYMSAWKMMIKAVAIYRDGSKLSQPLNSRQDEDLDEIVMLGDEDDLDETKGVKEVQERIIEKIVPSPLRKKLPKKRHGYVREAYVAGHKVFLRTGEYEDGSIGEIFIDMYKEGASFKGLMNCFAVLASKALQYGIPLEELVDSFTFTRFEPAGAVQGHEAIKNATSILDYVFRTLGYDYLGQKDFVHIKAVDEQNSNGHGNGNALSANLEVKVENDVPVVKEETIPMPLVKESSSGNLNRQTAREYGYTGEQCTQCGSMKVKRNGSCVVCEDCGTTSGCS